MILGTYTHLQASPGPIFHDITLLDAHALHGFINNVDILVGGFPCTNISISGDQSGFDGSCSCLFREMMRVSAPLAAFMHLYGYCDIATIRATIATSIYCYACK